MKRLAVALTASLLVVGLAVSTDAAAADDAAAVQERTGVLPDGTPYHISVPPNWTGIVVNDLDRASATGSVQESYFLQQGYAYTGTGRHPEREFRHDPRAELDNQVRVLDVVEAEFGHARRVIQTGCSGGGFVALGMAELYPDKVDGVVAFNARGLGGLVVANMWLDLPFALKALLAPDSDLPVAPIPNATRPAALQAWETVLREAQASETGRARVALAVTLAQWPTWSSAGGVAPSPPDYANLESVQQAMYRSATDGVASAIGRRALYDNPAGLTSWNVGVDYKRFYQNADPVQKLAVARLYAAAGFNGPSGVQADLGRINAHPRIAADPVGVAYWQARGRLLKGDVRVPLLHLHGVGDALLPPALTAGYEDGVRRQGKTPLYRQAFVDAAGHCSTNLAETAVGVETMLRRLETGTWGDTSPRRLNALGAALDLGVDARYTSFKLPHTLNRAYFLAKQPGSAH